MKILLLHTARSGSTSIMRYFEKVNPTYKVINQPWTIWDVAECYTLSDLSQYDDLFVKNEISWLRPNAPMITNQVGLIPTISDVTNFFDKIIILSRKNIEEQTTSLYIADENNSYSEFSSRLYDVSFLDTTKFNELKEHLITLNNFIIESLNDKFSHYYYEDLYFNSFDDLFKELNIPYNEKYFNQILDKSKKYKVGEINKNKQTKSVI